MTQGRDHLAERRAELARRLAALTPQQRAQLERSRGDAPAATPQGITPRETGAPVPMSFAQEVLWLLDRANPGMHGYNVPRTARLRGALDVPALERALNDIVARHEVLRSTFDMVDGELRQIVRSPRAVALDIIDLRDRSAASRETKAVALVRDLTRRPFDLTADSQLRSTLIRLADDDHVLLLESHHVASDAWSRNILLRELSALYDAYRTGHKAGLPPVAVQYGDFAIWQRDALRGERLARLLAYWREQLRDAPATLELPTDRARPVTPSFEGDARSRMLSLALLERLRELSRANDATLFMTLLAAFDVLLARYSGQRDIVVGSPIAGRAHEGTEGIIGYFANTLVLRAQFDDDPTFIELMGRVRESVLGAFEHQDVPYEKLVLELRSDRAMGSAPLFQTMFTLQDADLRTMQLPGLSIEPFGSARGATKFDLSLFMHEQQDGLRAAVEFRTDLYDAATIDRMLVQLEVLLEAIVVNPNARVSTLPLLPASERSAIEQWSSGGEQALEAETLHDLFAMQASRTPGATAVEAEGRTPDAALQTLTFRELSDRAGVLARYLAGAGVGPGVGVGICIERSPELVVAMLGVLQAGGFYLPLDPDYPSERLAFMLDDARVPVLLTTNALRDLVPPAERGDCTVVAIDTDWDAIAASSRAADMPRKATGGDLAYVIYTSGSTGRPKGVMIPHTAVVNYLTWMRAAFPLDTRDAVLQKAPASFDACIWEFFLPLVSGARLVLARPGGHQDPAYLLEALTRHDITLLQLVPSQLQMMLETHGADAPTGLPRLRRLFLGGEALPSELLSRLAAVCPALPVTNLYGPTEATVYASHWSVSLAEWHGGAVPIGRPIAGATIHLIDALGQPVPIGVPGELCIGGVGLARGYLNRAELTAEKFIDDPFSARRGAMLYRTGDRARYRADGTLEYLGRIDTQVKLRGFRVELGEIEHALVHLPDVQSSVVLVREDTPGDQRLVAYCIAAPGADPAKHTPASMRQVLKTSLPEFMVPTAFVWLSEWPMNANGKLDRKALPAPEARDAAVAERVAPRTPTEHAIAAIWSEILRCDVGVEDDFFEMGGHSLLALRTLARIADQFGTRIPLRALFDAPTIARLAGVVDAAGGMVGRGRARIARSPVDAFPLTPAQELLWLVQRTAPDTGAYNVADQWRIRGELDEAALAGALASLVQKHPALRTVVESRDGAVMQVVRDARPMDFQRHDLSVLDESTRAAKAHRLARELAARPFDLGSDQLLRAMLLTIGPDDRLLVTVTHHIAADGWARGIMLRDLTSAYDAIRSGESAGIAEPALRFGDFSVWQQEQLDNGGFAAQVEKWAELLGGASLTVDLPLDRTRPAVPRFVGAKKTVLLPLALLERLNALAAANDATLYMVLLAAFQTLLHRLSGQDDVMVQTTTAGRPRAELENIVGYFASTLAVRTQFGMETTFAGVLRSVREATLVGAENADVPFATLAADLTARGVVTPGAGSQVMFVMQNNESSVLRFGDATLEPRAVDARIAKMDLSLSAGAQRNGLRLALEYRTDLFEAPSADRIITQLGMLLHAVAGDASKRVWEYDIVTAEERRMLLARGTGPQVHPLGGQSTLMAVIAQRAISAPDSVALEEEGSGRTVTFGELVANASRIAAVLHARGVGHGDVVALHGEGTIATITAMFGVLAARAAYLPLDPDAPAPRLADMIADARAVLVIVDGRGADALAAHLAAGDAAHVPLQEAVELLNDRSAASDVNVFATAAAEDLAYIMYTSGSTGHPKGVEVEHRNLLNHESWIQNSFPVGPGDIVFALTALTFDPSLTELFSTLAAGARVLMPRPDMRLDPRYVLDVLRRRRIATLEGVPSVVRLLVDSATEPVDHPRHLIVGGEAMPPDLPRAVQRAFPNTLLHNAYGPTEVTVDALWFTVAPHTIGPLETRGAVPIGKPIGGARAYVVERSGMLAPPGASGELWVGGAGVARGYRGRPELTAERFLSDPFTGAPGRVYRTGDRVRWNTEGQLEFLGRLDDQVKIGGVRIEPGEIEGVLATQPGVRQVAVITRGDGASKQLIAYVAGDVTPAALRAAARSVLPPAMVPAAFVVLDDLPRNPSGKVDRSALPAPSETAFDRAEWVAPRTATERAVAQIWEGVLRHDRVGANDSFFDLGGNSLGAMRIVARMQEAGISVPLHAVFERGTVAKIAELADELRAAHAAEGGITRASRSQFRSPKSR